MQWYESQLRLCDGGGGLQTRQSPGQHATHAHALCVARTPNGCRQRRSTRPRVTKRRRVLRGARPKRRPCIHPPTSPPALPRVRCTQAWLPQRQRHARSVAFTVSDLRATQAPSHARVWRTCRSPLPLPSLSTPSTFNANNKHTRQITCTIADAPSQNCTSEGHMPVRRRTNNGGAQTTPMTQTLLQCRAAGTSQLGELRCTCTGHAGVQGSTEHGTHATACSSATPRVALPTCAVAHADKLPRHSCAQLLRVCAAHVTALRRAHMLCS
jgi:hypothetical protein